MIFGERPDCEADGGFDDALATSHLEDSGTSITSCRVMMVTAVAFGVEADAGLETSLTTNGVEGLCQ